MLKIVTDLNDPNLLLSKDDPVRPHIPLDFRVGKNRFLVCSIDSKPNAVVCVSLQDSIPDSELNLGSDVDFPTVAVFYTIWSYQPGAGAKLLLDTLDYIRQTYPGVSKFVTLSPKTKVAERFHIRNGATILRENDDTINYEYA